MQHENTHFIQFESHSLLFRHDAFADTKDYLADQLCIQEKVQVYFGQEAHCIGNDYCVIFCKVRKRGEAAFLTALQKLPSKMLLWGHADYLDFCCSFQALLNAPQEEGLHE